VPRNGPAPGTAAQWLARAKGDLAIAQLPLPEKGFLEDLVFHAQWAAEKSLKAVYQHHGWAFRYTHDLEELITGLKRLGLQIPATVEAVVVLTVRPFITPGKLWHGLNSNSAPNTSFAAQLPLVSRS